MTKANGHIKDPKEILELNKRLRKHYNKVEQVKQHKTVQKLVEQGKQNKENEMSPTQVSEAVNHPDHYNEGNIEAIAVIEDWSLDFHLGNVVKYICRSGKKEGNEVQDLEKALWYLQRKIKNLNSQE